MTTVGEAAAQSDTTSFVTTWRTDTANQAVAIPLEGSSMTVSWGDGQTDTGASGIFSHTYTNPGDHTVSVSGGLTRIHLNGHADAPKLISIDQWGSASWTTMESAFLGATNMAYSATDIPDLSGVANMTGMFRNAASFNGNISGWDVSKVTSMEGMFLGATSFNGNITKWDTSSVTHTTFMFLGATSFNQPLDWNTSSVTYVTSMFNGATSFNGNITKWDTSSVIVMGSMFSGATSFNGNITKWDTSSAKDMASMFFGATSFNQPLDWDTSSVTHTTSMFFGATFFNGNITEWDTSSVTNMASMFNGATSFNQPLDWDTSSVTNMVSMFNGATSFNQPLDWDTSSANDMDFVFRGATSFNQPLDWDTSSVTSMRDMFNGATFFNGNITEWDTSSVTNMASMFNGATSFNQPLDWDTSSANDMAFMFRGATFFNGNITEWDTSSVTNMASMFSGAAAFNGNITEWDTSSVTTMFDMFRGATYFNGNIPEWDTSKVTNMRGMFHGATAFNGNITKWDTSKVTTMRGMFHGATSFNGNITEWDTSSVADMGDMFSGAAIFNQPLGVWKVSSAAIMGNMFRDADAFDQNLGAWYIMLNSTAIDRTDIPGTVGQISSQNRVLNSQRPAYDPVSNIDSARFVINSKILEMTSITPAKATYIVNITATGRNVFENGNNWRAFNVTVNGDVVLPAPSLSTTATSPTNAASVTVTVDFGEAINAATFDLSDDVAVTGGTASSLSHQSGNQIFTFTITPSADGEVTAVIPADSVTDPAGNGNTASNVLSVTFDRTAPGPTLSTDAASSTNAASVTVTVDFGEPIDPATFTLADISVAGGAASSLAHPSGNQNFTFTITPSADGEVTASIPADRVTDPVDNGNTASNVLRVTFDSTAPSPTLSTDADSPTNSAFTATVDFGEPIDPATFTLADISVTGGTASSLAHSSANQNFTFTITPSADGEVTAVIPADSVTDPADNGNTASNVLRVTFDSAAPSPALSTDAASPTNAASVTVTVDFGEPIDAATFTLDDISVTGGDASVLAQDGPTTQDYTFTVTPSSDGQVTVTIPADRVTDPAGNSNTASNPLSVTFDRTAFGPALSTDAASPTNAASVTVTVDFGEPIDAATFTLDDISVTGGDAYVLAQEGATTQKYTFTVTPSSDGQVTVTIPADRVMDPADNGNTASNVLRVTFDSAAPSPALSTDAASPTNAASVTVTVDFGEPIDAATFTLDDISVTGGDASGLAQDGATTQKYTFTVTPSSDGQVTVTIPADRVMDPAGNSNTASNPLSVTFDRTAFGPALSTDADSPTNSASATITVDFGEPIDPATFTLDDISVTGGDASGLAQDGATTQKYTFTVTPSSDGQADRHDPRRPRHGPRRQRQHRLRPAARDLRQDYPRPHPVD